MSKLIKLIDKSIEIFRNIYGFFFVSNSDRLIFHIEKSQHLINQFSIYNLPNWGQVDNYSAIFRNKLNSFLNSRAFSDQLLIDTLVYMYASYIAIGYQVALIKEESWWEAGKLIEIQKSLSSQIVQTLEFIPSDKVWVALKAEIPHIIQKITTNQIYAYPNTNTFINPRNLDGAKKTIPSKELKPQIPSIKTARDF